MFIGGMIVYKANENVTSSYSLKDSVINLIDINRDIDFMLGKTFLYSDYDRLMELLANFDYGLRDILKLKNLHAFREISSGMKFFQDIKYTFKKKVELIDKFNSTAIFANLIYDDILFSSFEELKQSRYFNTIMANILLFKYDINTDLTKTKNLLNQHFTEENLSENDVKFITNANRLIEYYESAQSIFKRIQELYMQKELDILLDGNKVYMNIAATNLKNMTILFFALMVISILLIYLTYRKTKNILKYLNDLQQATDNSFGSIVFTDLNTKIKYVNKIFEQTTGYKLEEVVGKDANILKSYQHSNEFYRSITNSLKNNQVWECDELISLTKDKEFLIEKVMFLPLFDSDGNKDGYLSVKLDKTKEVMIEKELKEKEEKLRDMAFFDSLTGFGSYFALTQKLNEYPSGMLIYININHFVDFRFFYKTKTVDLIIESFAKTIKLCIDTYNMPAFIYRVQLDEFCIWYEGVSVEKDIRHLRDYFKSNDLSIMVDGRKELIPNIKMTIGVSLDRDTIQTNRLTQAMLAHYEATNKGEPVIYYNENSPVEQQYYQNQIMSRIIEYAIYNDTVIVECQGIYDISSDLDDEPKANYYEVLVRIVDENGKIRYPGEFLDIAKKISLYNDITKKVIGHVFRLVEKFPKVKFSMNLSNSDIENVQIRDMIEQKLKICSYPENVYFEILESEGVDDYEAVNLFINKIHSYNSKISIDDFGSGYSNYYRILELDIDTIKIDGSIIKKLPFDKNARYLVQTIVDFANRQKYNVVAEFVSSPEILDEVKKFGIKYAQGYLLGKPVSPNNIKL
ncbi:bifunctional diguanylate cyclase/phosphodiesterase [Campylobacter sp. RM16192]|uniref:bifunctional diguanylate cyclase/phosphodiesterase n=1 Tax=Campylobacter sp. RM16192 TaxID=1660080 RepID=UPI001C563ECC|nr:EAL domain-containing protein [Campylobacter sp. RM16192]